MGALAASCRWPSDGENPRLTRRYRFLEAPRSAGRSGPVPVDERLDDRLPLALLGDEGPRDHVRECAEAVDEGGYPEREPDQGDVDLEVGTETRTDSGDH